MNVKTTLREIRQMLNTGEALPPEGRPQGRRAYRYQDRAF